MPDTAAVSKRYDKEMATYTRFLIIAVLLLVSAPGSAATEKKFDCLVFTERDLGEYIRVWVKNKCGVEIELSIFIDPKEHRCSPAENLIMKSNAENTVDIYCPLHTRHYSERFIIRKK